MPLCTRVSLCIFGCILSMQCTAIITQYVRLIDPRTQHTVHLFSDVHIDTDDRACTQQQVHATSIFIKQLAGPKEVIVEDLVGVISKHVGIVDEQRFTHPRIFNTLAVQGSPDLIQVSMMYHSELGYGLMNIPVYNAEFRNYKDIPRCKNVAYEIMTYNDKALMNDYYEPIKKKIVPYLNDDKELLTCIQENEATLVDMRIMHRLYTHKQQRLTHSVVLAGGAHLATITKLLSALGYTVEHSQQSPLLRHLACHQITAMGDIVMHIYQQLQHGDAAIRKKYAYASNEVLSGQLGMFYKRFIKTLALDLSRLP